MCVNIYAYIGSDDDSSLGRGMSARHRACIHKKCTTEPDNNAWPGWVGGWYDDVFVSWRSVVSSSAMIATPPHSAAGGCRYMCVKQLGRTEGTWEGGYDYQIIMIII